MTRRFYAGLVAASLACTTPVFAQDAGWADYVDPDFGYRAELPYGLFMPAESAPGGSLRLVDATGLAQINLYGGPTEGQDITAFIDALARSDASRTIDYEAGGGSWAVLSGTFADADAGEPIVYYTKVLLSPDRESFSGFEISYPQSRKAQYDAIVERLEDGFTRPRA